MGSIAARHLIREAERRSLERKIEEAERAFRYYGDRDELDKLNELIQGWRSAGRARSEESDNG